MPKSIKILIPIFLLILAILPIAHAYSTLAQSSIDFESNDPDLAGKAWVILGVENQGVDKAIFDFKASDIKDRDNTKITATHDGSITSELTVKQCKYTIQNRNTPIRKLEIISTYPAVQFWNQAKWQGECAGLGGELLKERFSYTYKCVGFKQSSVSGLLREASFSDKLDITVTSNGISKTVSVSNDPELAPQSAKVDNYLYVKQQALVDSGRNCPNVDVNYGVVYDYSKGTYLVNKAELEAYKESVYILCVNEAMVKGTKNIEECVAEQNVMYNDAITPVTFSQYNYAFAGNIGNGKLVLNNVPISKYPLFTMKISAAWLGVYTPVGIPQVSGLTSNCFKEGSSQGLITGKVNNVGDYIASFGITGTCTEGFSISPVDNIIVQKGSSVPLVITLTGQTQSKTKGTCTIKAYDINNPSKTSEGTVNVCVQEIVGCSPEGLNRCMNNYLEQCTGGLWGQIKLCEYGCVVKDGKPQCSSKIDVKEICDDGIDNDNDGLVDLNDPDCKEDDCGNWIEIGSFAIPDLWCAFANWVDRLLTPLKIVLAIVGAVFTFFFVDNFVTRKKLVKDGKASLWVALAFAIGFAVLAWYFFYWGLATLILLLIIKFATGGLI